MIALPGDEPSGLPFGFCERERARPRLRWDAFLKGSLQNSQEATNVFSNFINLKDVSCFALQMSHAVVIILLLSLVWKNNDKRRR